MIFNSNVILTKIMVSSLLIVTVSSQQLNGKCSAKNEKLFCQDPNVCLCFIFKDKSKSWREANRDCQNSGGRLASLQKNRVQEILPWLKGLLNNSNQNFWVDLKREDGGDWRWTHYNEKADWLTVNKGDSFSYPICAFAASDPYSRRAGFHASQCHASWDEKDLPVLCAVKEFSKKLRIKIHGKGVQELAYVGTNPILRIRCTVGSWACDHFVFLYEGYDRLTGLEKCKEIGGVLASFSAPEHETVFKKLAEKAHDREFGTWKVWIGLKKEEGIWKWDNGRELLGVFEEKGEKRDIFWNDNEPAHIKHFSCGSLYYNKRTNGFLTGQSQKCFDDGKTSSILSEIPFLCEKDYFKKEEEQIKTIDWNDPLIADKINKIEGLKMFETIENEMKHLLINTDLRLLQLITLKGRMEFIQVVHDQIKDHKHQTKTELEMVSSLNNILELKPVLTEEVQRVIGKCDVKSIHQFDGRKLTMKDLKEKVLKTLPPFEHFTKALRHRTAALNDVVIEHDKKCYDLLGQIHYQNEVGKDRKKIPETKSRPTETISSSTPILVSVWLLIVPVVLALIS